MAGVLHSGMYSGMIIASAENVAPAGWLACDGTFKSQSTYANLFAAIGHTYNGGVDPGNGTFKLPSLNTGLAPRGASVYSPAGTTGGSNAHSHSFTTSVSGTINTYGPHNHNGIGPFTTNNAGSHSHNFNAAGAVSSASGSNTGNAKVDNNAYLTASGGHTHDVPLVGSITGGNNHSHSGTVAGLGTDGNHNHGGPNVVNSSISVNNEVLPPHHFVFYMIKT